MDELQAFASHLKLDIGGVAYHLYKLFTPSPITAATHILSITTRRRPGITDLSIAFDIVDAAMLKIAGLETPGDLTDWERAHEISIKAIAEQSAANLAAYPRQTQIGVFALFLEMSDLSVYFLQLNLLDLKAFPDLFPELESPFAKRAMFGIPVEGEDWVAMLKQRATASAFEMKDGSVPGMTLREYERWKEGVRPTSADFAGREAGTGRAAHVSSLLTSSATSTFNWQAISLSQRVVGNRASAVLHRRVSIGPVWTIEQWLKPQTGGLETSFTSAFTRNWVRMY